MALPETWIVSPTRQVSVPAGSSIDTRGGVLFDETVRVAWLIAPFPSVTVRRTWYVPAGNVWSKTGRAGDRSGAVVEVPGVRQAARRPGSWSAVASKWTSSGAAPEVGLAVKAACGAA